MKMDQTKAAMLTQSSTALEDFFFFCGLNVDGQASHYLGFPFLVSCPHPHTPPPHRDYNALLEKLEKQESSGIPRCSGV